MTSPLVFELPQSAQYFTPFSRLPPELRFQIWEHALFAQGMHFLSITADLLQSPPSLTGAHRRRTFYGALTSLFSHQAANPSQYKENQKTIATLRDTCQESKRLVDRNLAHPGTIRLAKGDYVFLGGSTDVICLSFLPAEDLRRGCPLVNHFSCPDLDRIRHMAVAYSPTWQDLAAPCTHCSTQHHRASGKLCPVGIWQFLARYCAGLKTFYFIDYTAVRKGVGEIHEQNTKPQEPCPCHLNRFESWGRTFQQVEPSTEEWHLSKDIWDMLELVRESFVALATEIRTDEAFPRSHQDPESVEFRVLACYFTVSPPTMPTKPSKQARNAGSIRASMGSRRPGPSRRLPKTSAKS